MLNIISMEVQKRIFLFIALEQLEMITMHICSLMEEVLFISMRLVIAVKGFMLWQENIEKIWLLILVMMLKLKIIISLLTEMELLIFHKESVQTLNSTCWKMKLNLQNSQQAELKFKHLATLKIKLTTKDIMCILQQVNFQPWWTFQQVNILTQKEILRVTMLVN